MRAVVRPSKNPLEALEIILILCPDKSSRKSTAEKSIDIVEMRTPRKRIDVKIDIADPLAFVEVLEDPLQPTSEYFIKSDKTVPKVPMEVDTEKPKNIAQGKRRQLKNDTRTGTLISVTPNLSQKSSSPPKRSIIKFTADYKERSALRKSVVKFDYSSKKLSKNEISRNVESLPSPLTSRKISVVPFKDTKIS